MKTGRLLIVVMVTALIAGAATSLVFADKQDKAKSAESGMTPEQMAQWQSAATPGEHHQHLKGFVGEWNTTIKSWQAPGAEPEVSTGKSTVELVMGGRYALEHFEGTMMGMPFRGLGVIGYDNVAKKHTTVWLDNMSTQMLYSEGNCSNHCMTTTFQATMRSPFGGEVKMRFVTNVVDDNKRLFEYYMIGEDGAEFKSMEITYERA
jgi:hypothetical protein